MDDEGRSKLTTLDGGASYFVAHKDALEPVFKVLADIAKRVGANDTVTQVPLAGPVQGDGVSAADGLPLPPRPRRGPGSAPREAASAPTQQATPSAPSAPSAPSTTKGLLDGLERAQKKD